MATKNHFSNYENLFSAYRDSISNYNTETTSAFASEIASKRAQLTTLQNEIKAIESTLNHSKNKVPVVDTRRSTEFLPKFLKQREQAEKELTEVKIANPTLSSKQRTNLETTIKLEKDRLEKTKFEIDSLTISITDPETPQNSIASLKTKRTKAKNLQKSIESNLVSLLLQIKEDDDKLTKIKTSEAKLKSVENKYNAILLDEKKYARQTAPSLKAQIDQEIKETKLKRRKLQIKEKNLIKEIEELEKQAKTVPTTNTGNIDEFKKFLTDNSFSTVHAEELFELCKNPNHKLSSLTKNEFKLRKQHPKRDKFLKKFLIPTTLTAGGVGLGCGAVASAIATGGSQWLWIQFTSSASVNFLQAAIPGAVIGAAAAISTITLKDAFTKLHYNRKYGNANKILNDPESARLEELLEKIENTKENILDSRKGTFLTKLPRAITRTVKNIVNRNRIHHIESITEQLVEKFNEIINNNAISLEVKLEKLTPINDALTKINSFYANDIKKSKIFAMLNCKETDKNHSHKETIENLDIYAKLNMYLEKVNSLEQTTKSEKKKVHKQVKKDLIKQNVVAERLLNGESVTGLVSKRYLELVKASDKLQTPASKSIDSYIVSNGDLIITFKDGNSTNYQVENAEQIKTVESVNKGKTLLITYKNGEQVSISSSSKSKINLNIAGEFKVYDKLQEVGVINYLVEQKGIDTDTIFNFIDAIKATKFNKNGKEKAKPSAFMKSKAYKENPEYAKIIKEVADIIKNPNIVNIDYGFNA